MGNLRFRLSDMMPNAWFYKLKDMSSAGATSHKRGNGKKLHPATPPPSQPSKPKQPHHHQQHSYSRKSYYFTRDLSSGNPNHTDNTLPNSPSKLSDHPPTPRKSSKRRAAAKTARSSSPKLVSSSVSAGCSCRANWTKTDSPAVVAAAVPGDRSASLSDSNSDSFPPEFRSDCSLTTESFDKMVSWSSNSCGCPLDLVDSGSNDIIIDIDKRSLVDPAHQVFEKLPDRQLPPILTKPSSFDDRIEDIKRKETREVVPSATKQRRTPPSSKKMEGSKTRASSLSVKVTREESLTVKQQGRKLNSANSPGIKLRVNSPRIGYRRNIQGQGRKSVSSSTSTSSSSRSSSSKKSLSGCLAVVKSSFDPQTDFRESMVEMIVENKLSASKDLEDLLACYLSLNSDEYHEVIIKVFKQIWFDYLTNARSK
ncbi:unnamed protein product [Linum tenue]|uniref:Transcription repressor n=1 Tax=Linum tenue TaxID=586396 RepID=A0AAV0KQU1_9ROSI|nr:unnamed protein product [Linum tenue]